MARIKTSIIASLVSPILFLLFGLLYLAHLQQLHYYSAPTSFDYDDGYYHSISQMINSENLFYDPPAADINWSEWINRGEDSLAEAEFGFGWLDAWKLKMTAYCEPNGTDSMLSSSTLLQCATHTQVRVDKGSHPHTFCVVNNIGFHPAKTVKAGCPKHRPGYHCEIESFLRYEPGAFQGHSCAKVDSEFQLSHFSRDHMRDIFESFEVSDAPIAVDSSIQTSSSWTIFFTREIREYTNLFHTMTEWLNVFSSMYMLQLRPSQVQLFLLDSHSPSRFDEVWDVLFSSGDRTQATLRPHALHNRTYFAKNAIFPATEYSNFLLADLTRTGAPKSDLKLLKAFVSYMLQRLGVKRVEKPGKNIKIILISRRGKKIDRQLSNEPEIQRYLKSQCRDCEIMTVDLSRLTFRNQIALVSRTDLLIGVHGAGLTLASFLPPYAAILEIWQAGGQWRCFEHIAAFSGIGYFRARNTVDMAYFLTRTGWSLRLSEADLEKPFVSALQYVREKRALY